MDLILNRRLIFYDSTADWSFHSRAPLSAERKGGVVARKATWLVGSLGVESASRGATAAAGNSITHTESFAGLVLAVEDLPVPSWSVRRWPCGDERGGGD